jgi:hypothetical protein
MRPTPAEIITGVRRILKEVVEPDVASEYARERLAQVRAVLAQVDWNDSLTELASENVRVANFGRRALDWSDSNAARAAAFSAESAAVRAACADVPTVVEPFAEHNARNCRQNRAMIDFCARLTSWVSERPDDPGAAELLRSARALYARKS